MNNVVNIREHETLPTIGKEDVARDFRVSETTARDRIMKRPGFPRPINPWGQRKRYLKSDYEAWLLNQRQPSSLAANS